MCHHLQTSPKEWLNFNLIRDNNAIKNEGARVLTTLTRIVRGSDYSPASELFARERQTMTGNNAKLDLVNVDAHKKIGQILTICS